MRALILPARLLVSFAACGAWLATPAWADPFVFSTGAPDGLLGALSQPARASSLDTETADDFILTTTTSIAQATVTGLVPAGTALEDISNVEVEIYHVFPKDSADPASNHVPTRMNSPADVEIDSATRDANLGTLDFAVSRAATSFAVANTVADDIKLPATPPGGEGPANGDVFRITMTFNPPIELPAEHYFFRPHVEVAGADFLYLSAPKPIVAPGTPFTGDLQAWIRNSDLAPDWLRIGTDIIAGTPVVTFNMTFSLMGETLAPAPTPTTTATSTPTVTPADPPMGNGDSGCSIGAGPSANHLTFWLLLAPAAALWWMRRR